MQLTHFRVTNYRNVTDSGWIEVGRMTAFVGQNEAGKSNLFEALSRINPLISSDGYDIEEDWPVDNWSCKDPAAIVCEAKFALSADDRTALYATAAPPGVMAPAHIDVQATRTYGDAPTFRLEGAASADLDGALDRARADRWIRDALPKFVYVHDYEFSGAQIELPYLAERVARLQWHELSNEEQTVKIVLDLAQLDVADFLRKGESSEGRTVRAFDKRAASAFLSKQFCDLWRQKKVAFDIDIDGPTLNIFARDEAVGMPVRLERRSSGFRWYVSFAWKFTHASKGRYKDCVLLLEEPGIHLHHAGQRDLLTVFERLAENNTILFTTHLSSMIDLANPATVRIVETHDNHAVVKKGVVSAQRAPAAVIEVALGLTGELIGLLGTRQTLIVGGGDDALILHKLSGLLRAGNKPFLSDRIYLWPAEGTRSTAMYAAVAAGNGWDAGVLLDNDPEGLAARGVIEGTVLKELPAERQAKFLMLMLGEAAGIGKTEAAVEDLFDEDFYVDCVNTAFGVAIARKDLPMGVSGRVAKRVERLLADRYGHKALDRRRVMREIFRRFDKWTNTRDLPTGTLDKATRLFVKINNAFGAAAKL